MAEIFLTQRWCLFQNPWIVKLDFIACSVFFQPVFLLTLCISVDFLYVSVYIFVMHFKFHTWIAGVINELRDSLYRPNTKRLLYMMSWEVNLCLTFLRADPITFRMLNLELDSVSFLCTVNPVALCCPNIAFLSSVFLMSNTNV